MKKETNLVYYFVVYLCRIVFKLWFRVEYIGLDNLPREGGCIAACNHSSFLDPPLFGSCIGAIRPIHMVARSTLIKNRFVGWLYRKLLTILIDRDRGDMKALRTVLSFLKQGSLVALFPEGTRSKDGKLQPAKNGIGFMICKAKVPVVPLYIDGSFSAMSRDSSFIKPVKIRIYFGKPITLEEFDRLPEGKERYPLAGELVMQRIAELIPNREN